MGCNFRDITYTDGDGTALARLLDGNGVRLTKVGTPVTTTDGDNVELGDDDGGTDGGSDFLGGLDTETDVAVGVTNEDDGLEAGALTGTGLLLDGLDLYFEIPSVYSVSLKSRHWTFSSVVVSSAHLHNLILEGGEEEVDDLVLLDGERVEVDLLHALDLAGLHETTELGDGLPLLLLALRTTAGATTTATATATVTAALGAATGSKSTSVGHFVCCCWVGRFVVGRGGQVANLNPSNLPIRTLPNRRSGLGNEVGDVWTEAARQTRRHIFGALGSPLALRHDLYMHDNPDMLSTTILMRQPCAYNSPHTIHLREYRLLGRPILSREQSTGSARCAILESLPDIGLDHLPMSVATFVRRTCPAVAFHQLRRVADMHRSTSI